MLQELKKIVFIISAPRTEEMNACTWDLESEMYAQVLVGHSANKAQMVCTFNHVVLDGIWPFMNSLAEIYGGDPFKPIIRTKCVKEVSLTTITCSCSMII